MTLPSPLKPGDTIGLVTPAGPVVDPQQVQDGIRILETRGYRVKITASLERQESYLAGSDQDRAEQITSVWEAPEIDGIIAVRGGYGCMRLLPLLDLETIRKHPKPLLGFSDISLLLNVICQETDTVTFHGPMLNTLSRSNQQSVASLFTMLESKDNALYQIPETTVLTKGESSGQLIGGNLTSLAHLIGTPYDFPWDGAILFLEDTGEALYRIDRLLTHLHAAGKLQKLAGLILGTFTDVQGNEETWTERAWKRALELVGENFPVWGNFPCGHGERNLTLPVGRTAIMDSASKTLVFEE